MMYAISCFIGPRYNCTRLYIPRQLMTWRRKKPRRQKSWAWSFQDFPASTPEALIWCIYDRNKSLICTQISCPKYMSVFNKTWVKIIKKIVTAYISFTTQINLSMGSPILTHKFCQIRDAVLTISCLFSLLWRTTRPDLRNNATQRSLYNGFPV